jgi:hypothetical protein
MADARYVMWKHRVRAALAQVSLTFLAVAAVIASQAPPNAALRVYYAINGLFRDPPKTPPVPVVPFQSLGEMVGDRLVVRDRLPIKNYKFWVALDGNPSQPLSPVTDVRVRQQPEVTAVSLAIQQGK